MLAYVVFDYVVALELIAAADAGSGKVSSLAWAELIH